MSVIKFPSRDVQVASTDAGRSRVRAYWLFKLFALFLVLLFISLSSLAQEEKMFSDVCSPPVYSSSCSSRAGAGISPTTLFQWSVCVGSGWLPWYLAIFYERARELPAQAGGRGR